tara:strand:- start:118 stop:288 length:171 start_codon:yes stop_codon:yes gene_type:complete
MAFKIHMTNEKYDTWTVEQFLRHELECVKELYAENKDEDLLYVIDYLEKRLNGKIK